MFFELNIKTNSRTEFKNITSDIDKLVKSSNIDEGICLIFVPHTTAGITINENADPAVRKDILKELNKVIPFDDNYSHSEGNSSAHIKAGLMGFSCCIPVASGSLKLGTWQGIYFAEFDGPRNRKVYITVQNS